MTNKCLTVLCTGLCAFISLPSATYAQSTTTNTSLFIPAVYPIENAWQTQTYDFKTPVGPAIVTDTKQNNDISVANKVKNTPKKEYKSDDEDEDEDFGDKILNKLPFKNSLKYTWNVIDGDIDLYFEGLRFDRGNKGLEYKTDTLPYFGKIDGMRIKAEMGESQKLTFETDYIPLMGRVDGFNFKASASDNSKISFRYKKPFP